LKITLYCYRNKGRLPSIRKKVFNVTRQLVVLVSILTMLVSSASTLWAGKAASEERATEAAQAEEAPASGSQESSSDDEDQTAAADTTVVFPEKMPKRKTWEYVVSAPGYIIYLPFWAVFKVTEGAISLQERYRIGHRLATVLIAPDGSRGIIPVYSSRSGFGLEYFHKHIPNEDARLNLTASWGLLGRSLYQARARRIGVGPLTLGGQLTFRDMPDERFYGIGPDSKEEDETNYEIKTATGEIALGKRFSPRFVVGGIIGVDHNITGPGQSDQSPSTTDEYPGLPGLDEELTVSRLTLAMFYDGSNRPYRPTSGFVIEARARVDQEIQDDHFAYTTAFLDIIRHQGLWRDRTLFLRFAFRLSDPLNEKQIPFYQLSELGAVETIRGFQRGRFRDFDVVLGTAEYRYPISPMIDALLFVDAGQVQQDIFKDLSGNDTQITYGGGFRVWKSEGTLIRLEVGWSEEGYRFLFQLNPTGERRTFAYF